MVKTLYVVRHCRAQGQEPQAPLTAEGTAQAEDLAAFLAGKGIRRIVSSPYARARRSIAPLAERLGLAVELDDRLVERVLGAADLPDWLDRLRESFEDLDLSLERGESSRVAMERAAAVVGDVLAGDADTVALVSHGNLIVLLLKHFDRRFGFLDWERLTCPDVFRVTVAGDETSIERVWS